MLPGMGEMRTQIDNIDEREIDRVAAIIQSMTPAERADVKMLNGSRRARIARGSGHRGRDVNSLVDRFLEARKMMRQMAKGGGMPGMPGMPGMRRLAGRRSGQEGQGRVRKAKAAAPRQPAPSAPSRTGGSPAGRRDDPGTAPAAGRGLRAPRRVQGPPRLTPDPALRRYAAPAQWRGPAGLGSGTLALERTAAAALYPLEPRPLEQRRAPCRTHAATGAHPHTTDRSHHPVAVKIKLKRLGKMRNPQYRIVVADARTKRDGRAIEEIGKYQPKEDPSLIEVDSERAQYWLGVGAQPTEAVAAILKVTGDWQKFKGLPGAEGTLRVAEPKAEQEGRLRGRRQGEPAATPRPATTPRKKAAKAAEAPPPRPSAEAEPAEAEAEAVAEAAAEPSPRRRRRGRRAAAEAAAAEVPARRGRCRSRPLRLPTQAATETSEA